jgi:type IV secretion system protein VirB5
MKRRTGCLLTLFLLIAGAQAQAQGIPVIDSSNLAQAIAQLQAWAKQYEQMRQNISVLEQQYNSISGIRNMGDLINNQTIRHYLPDDANTLLSDSPASSLSSSINFLRDAAKIVGIEDTKINKDSITGKALTGVQDLNAMIQAAAAASYDRASKRFEELQILLDKVNESPDQKDILDLQARIASEQTMLQNENAKLQSLSLIADNRRATLQQQSHEISIKAIQGDPPRF